MSDRGLVLVFGRAAAATEGMPGRKVLPGSAVARSLGCICDTPCPTSLPWRWIVSLDSDCPAPKRMAHTHRARMRGGTMANEWSLWQYHETPWP